MMDGLLVSNLNQSKIVEATDSIISLDSENLNVTSAIVESAASGLSKTWGLHSSLCTK